MHKAIKVEKQLKSKGGSKFGVASNSSWKSNWKKNTTDSKPKEDVKAKSLVTSSKGKTNTKPFTRTREIKCFRCQGFGHIASQCPNQRVVITRDNGDVESVLVLVMMTCLHWRTAMMWILRDP